VSFPTLNSLVCISFVPITDGDPNPRQRRRAIDSLSKDDRRAVLISWSNVSKRKIRPAEVALHPSPNDAGCVHESLIFDGPDVAPRVVDITLRLYQSTVSLNVKVQYRLTAAGGKITLSGNVLGMAVL
jgi:hypothetical protein